MLGVVEKASDLSELDDFPRINDGDLMAIMRRNADIAGYEQH